MGARKKNEEEVEVRNRSGGRRNCTSMEPDSKGASMREKKNNTRSKDTTDKAARQGRMEGKQLQTLSFPWVLNQEIFYQPKVMPYPKGGTYG